MAEFKDVIRHYQRMIKSWKDSGLFNEKDIEKAAKDMIAIPNESAALSFERYVMCWAKEHPENKYPSWADYLMDIGVIGRVLPHEAYKLVSTLSNSEIPENIAKKLGIEPLNNAGKEVYRNE